MSDVEEDERLSEGDVEEGETVLPEVWKFAQKDKVGKIVKLLSEKEDEELIEAVKEKNPETGHILLLWATLGQRFIFVEWLLKKCKRDAFAFKPTELAIYDKWVEERKAKEEREKERLEAQREAEAAGEEIEEEEAEPEPELWQVVLEGMEEEGVDKFLVQRIGELGVYEGGRDPQGNKHGMGKALFKNGDLYIGEYMNNKRHGIGTYYWASNGNIYIGEWQDNQRWGIGRMIYQDGGRYYGSFLYDKKEGNGRYTYPNGNNYDGEWQSDQKEGTGVYTFASDSSKYVGTFRNGDFTCGKWLLSGNVVYYGVFKNFKPTGKGVFVFDNKYKQEGEYINDKWRPSKVRNLNAQTEDDLMIAVGDNTIQLRYTPESAGKGNIAELVQVANCSLFEEWKKSIECHSDVGVKDIVIRAVDYHQTHHDINRIRLKISTVNKLTSDQLQYEDIVLQSQSTVIVILLVNNGTEYCVTVTTPNVSGGDFNSVELPWAVKDAIGLRGGPMDTVRKVLNIPLTQSSMVDVMSLYTGSTTPLFNGPFQSSDKFSILLFKQSVHSDYLSSLNSRISYYSKEGNWYKVNVQPINQVMSQLSSTRSVSALTWLRSLGDQIPQQTTPPQRPPTPPPPEPEPIPLYTDHELALQKAALEAEMAAKKRQEEKEVNEDAEEEE